MTRPGHSRMAVPLAAFTVGAVVALLVGVFGKVHDPTLDGSTTFGLDTQAAMQVGLSMVACAQTPQSGHGRTAAARVASQGPGDATGAPPRMPVGGAMGLQDGKVGAAIAVTDMDRAVEFYEGKLGLSPAGGDEPDGGRTYECAGETTLHIFPSSYAKASGATVAGWVVEDVEGTVDELIGKGVTFEHYTDGPVTTDEKGVARMGDYVGAWVKDPDGNVVSLGSQ